MTQSPEPAFALNFTGNIWRVVADPAGNLLVAEVQNPMNGKQTFAVVDTRAGKLVWQDFTLTAYHRLTAVAVHQGTLYLQALSGSQPPQPAAVIAVDVASQNILWQQPGGSWYGVVSDGVTVVEMNFDRYRYLLLHPQDGRLNRELTAGEVRLLEDDQVQTTVYLVHYPEGNSHSVTIAKFIEDKTGVQPVHVFDYAQPKEVVVISYYLYHTGKYENYIALFDRAGCLLWQQRIAAGLPGTGTNTFFITENLLIFVREKNQLLGYVL